MFWSDRASTGNVQCFGVIERLLGMCSVLE